MNAEYFPQFSNLESTPTFNVLSFGFDIETGGHVFQLIVTNTQTMLEKAFIAETTGDWANGDIHLGFNISRTFQLKH